ncbi:hypothetical protein [Streptacidiphilus fuscans]|uniref:Transmembrane transport protein n=1 Tax=Streptacidiphilus fuscans TaxID=2789292 RepID=A0A931AXD2_9ACTN|nr:hypothetical protein [Streptacidiphilus fuscans]MBF9066491.1 hypothetical protein [Streptacidiphilus fuscans]
MIWLTWRQFRTQALAALGAVVVVGLLFALTGPQLAQLADSTGLSGCAGTTCGTATSEFFDKVKADSLYPLLYFVGAGLLALVPAAIGIFWGAPLVSREVETGTFRLAWSQSVTRTRWLAVKLGVVGLAAVAVSALLSLLITWWSSPIDHAAALPGGGQDLGQALPDRFMPLIFGARDLLPVGCAVFAFVLGVASGVLARRLLPAMVVTLAALTAVQLLLPLAVRPHYETPEKTTSALVLSDHRPGIALRIDGTTAQVSEPVSVPGGWVTSVRTVDSSGTPWNGPAPQACGGSGTTPEQCMAAINALHLNQIAEYQPADRYWTFQWIETGLYLTGSALLAAFSAWRIRGLRLN